MLQNESISHAEYVKQEIQFLVNAFIFQSQFITVCLIKLVNERDFGGTNVDISRLSNGDRRNLTATLVFTNLN